MFSSANTNEIIRLERLRDYRILDTDPEPAFDDLAQLAAHIAATPIATITLIDEHRQWFKSCIGLPMRETDRAIAFCDYAIRGTDPLILPNILQDPRFADNPLVIGEPYLRFYAGFPLVAPDGVIVGTVTVMDGKSRQLSQEQVAQLQIVARQVVALLEARQLSFQHQELLAEQEQTKITFAALRESEERFRHLFTSAATGIVMAHLDGHYIAANPAYCATVGYSEEQLLSMNLFDITHPDDHPRCAFLIRQLANGVIPSFVIEKRYVKDRGEIVWVWASVGTVPTLSGDSQYMIAVTLEVTQQKIIEEKLKESESILRIAGQVAHLGGWAVDMGADRVIWSDEVCVLHEMPPGTSPRISEGISYYAPEWREVIREAFEKCVSEGHPFSLEAQIITATGRKRWVQAIGEALCDEHGTVTRVHGAFQDIEEKKQNEAKLHSLATRLTNIVESITDAFYTLDREWRFTYINHEAEALLMHPRTELMGRNIWEIFPQAVNTSFYNQFQQAVHDNVTVAVEDYYAPFKKWFDVRAFPSQDGLSVFFRDVTEWRAALDALRTSEERYRLLFNHNPHPMWVYDVETLHFLAVNDAAIAHYGYSEQEFLSMTLRDIRPPEDIARLERDIAGGIPRKSFGLWRHRKKDGTLIDVEITSDTVTFNDRPARIVLASDVTARRRAEEQVREQAALLDKAQDAIIVRDLDHRVTYWNRSAERLYGWQAEEVLGHRIDELLRRDKSAFQRQHEQVLAKGEWIGEIVNVARDGRELLIEGRWTLVRDDDGQPRSVLMINTDITERKKLEEQFLRAQRLESIGTLAGGIAHDLNNVLAPIIMSLGMLRSKDRPPSELRLLKILEDSAQQGAAMVRQVLTFARGMDGERTVVQVDAVIQELARLVRDTFDRKIRVKTDLPDSLWPVLGDATQIHQVLLNLCVNARDAMPEGGELRLAAENITLDAGYAALSPEIKPGQYILIRVSDSGTGIPKAIRDRIFDPFFTTKEVGKGTGLGLATVQAVVKSHGGQINVYSEEEYGTEFRIYLPAQAGEEESAHVDEPAQLQRGHGETILVVDDEDAVREITQQTLEAFGYRALVAADGADALAVYMQHRADIAVVLTDMMMPVMDGLAMIQALRKIDPQVKIIAASGLAASTMVTKAINSGVRHFLPKPYTAEVMLGVLAEILERN